MTRQVIHVQHLLGEKVFAQNGKPIGRLEDIRTEMDRGHFFVSEFLVGSYAFLSRLAAWRMGRTLLRLFGARRSEGYRIPWDKLDLSDPHRPRLLCEVKELLRLKKEQYPS
jgi:sporulation protein YlmC with PRC-barrel domain